jgi:nucleotide-binding universal stress UspA family protein
MTIAKIIVGTDFSQQAEAAVEHSLAVARHAGAEVVLMHALSMPEPDYVMPYPVTTPAIYVEQVDAIVKEARAKLDEMRERHIGQGVEVSHVFVNDMADRGLVQVATETEADLVVVGSHGRTGISRFLLGSVAEKVVRRAPCDVLVARGDAPAGGYKRILLPVDFSEVSDRAMARAAELVEPGGKVDLLHCWQLPGGSVTYWGSVGPGLGESIVKGANEFGRKAIERVGTTNAEFSLAIEEGDARHSIEKRTENGDYDLVLMGSHGRKGINRALLGSVAESTLRHLKTAVYVARAGHGEDAEE